jgi:hypothetical protein
MRRRGLTGLALLSIAMLGFGAAAAGSARRVSLRESTGSINLRIVYSEPRGGFGPERYSLRCNPAAGTLPHAQAACAAIAKEPELVLAGPGRNHSCPAGLPGIRIRGDYLGRHVDLGFSGCVSRPGDLSERWESLLPATLQKQERVRLDRGFGLFSLDQRRSAVLGLLFHPQEQLAGMSVYRPEVVEKDFQGSAPKVFGVRYDRAGRVVGLLSDWNRLAINGYSISIQTPIDQSELIGRLKGWVPVHCGKVRGLTDHPLRHHVPRTTVWMAGEQATVSISGPEVAICSAAIRSLILQPVRPSIFEWLLTSMSGGEFP